MTRKLSNWILMAALTVGLGLSVTSCKDDNDDKNEENKTEEQKAQEAQEQADVFWDVVGQLTSMDNYTVDYKDKTFEPTIGEPQEGNATIRIVATNDMASAAQRFANLVGLGSDFDLNTTNYEWKNDTVGTLTYHKTDDGQSWATVDVNIKQMPQLQQIIYQSAEQGGLNGSFEGSAYYRFGDVVSRENTDGKTEYWVCVRPAFGKQGKGDSHWITLSPLPEKNLEHIKKYNRDFYIPTGLGTNEEHMQNLAEMLWAMMNPEKWFKNVTENDPPSLFRKGLRMFHDFSHAEDKIKYHNQFFWQRVCEAWESEGLFKKILGFDSDDNHFPFFKYNKYEELFNEDNSSLHLLYSKGKWHNSDYLTLYEYTYKNGDDPWELNMHKATKREVDTNMTNERFDLKSDYTQSAPYLVKPNMFGDDEPRYIIRHATGQELTAKGSKWNYKQPIDGVTPVYVYNRYFYPAGTDGAAPNQHFRDLTIREPEVTPDNNKRAAWNRGEYNGDSFYLPGDVCIDELGSRWFCFMQSGNNTNNNDALLNAPFSYFITFDNIIDEQNDDIDLEIATEGVIPKVMLPILTFINNYSFEQSRQRRIIYNNIKDNTGVDLMKMALIRDTVVTESDTQQQSLRGAICTSVAFLNEDKSQWQLMRIIQNGAYDLRHDRQWYYFFNTKYENSEEPILLSDIANQEKVNRYAPDRWAVLPLHGTEQRLACRTQADGRATNYKNYFWDDGIPQTDATSMWNEPVLIFRVARVYDRGGNHATITGMGRKFSKIILSSLHKDDSDAAVGRLWWPLVSQGAYTMDLMRKNGKVYKWPDWNNDNLVNNE